MWKTKLNSEENYACKFGRKVVALFHTLRQKQSSTECHNPISDPFVALSLYPLPLRGSCTTTTAVPNKLSLIPFKRITYCTGATKRARLQYNPLLIQFTHKWIQFSHLFTHTSYTTSTLALPPSLGSTPINNKK